MKRKFYVVLEKEDSGGYSVYIPELSQATCGETLDECFDMAYECACSTICCYEDENMEVVLQDFDVNEVKQGQQIAIIDVDTEEYRKKVLNKAKKVTLTIPEYLYNAADELNLNKSKLLQQAILAELNNHKTAKRN